MAFNYSTNNYIYTGPRVLIPAAAYANGVLVAGVSFAPLRFYALAINLTDLYTVPTGKRLFLLSASAFNPTGGSITWQAQLKVSGSYYGLMTPLAVGTGAASAIQSISIVLEAGEAVACNATVAGLNVTCNGYLLDNTGPLRTGKKLGLTTGDNVIYTCPVGRSALVVGAGGAVSANGTAIVSLSAGAVATGIGQVCLVAAGGATTCTALSANQVVSLATTAANTRTANTSGALPLQAGDFLVVNVTSGDPAQMAWVTVTET